MKKEEPLLDWLSYEDLYVAVLRPESIDVEGETSKHF